jgi:hypothetical protein
MHSAHVTKITVCRQDYRCHRSDKALILFCTHRREFPSVKRAAGLLNSEINSEACKVDRSLQYSVEVQNV